MHPYLFIDFAMWLNPKFKLQVIRFVYDQLIELRHQAGDLYRVLGRAAGVYEDTDYAKLAIALNHIVFGKHDKELRQRATTQQLSELADIQKKLAFAIDMGYIQTFNDLLRELRRMYKFKWQYHLTA